jgi:Tfp pilus assembly protein PilO
MKRISREQLLVIGLSVGGLLVGLLGYMAAVAPQRSQAKKLDGEVQLAQTQLLAAQQAKVPKVKGAAVGAADLFRLAKAMPGTDDVSSILIQLSHVAQSSDVELVSVRPGQDVPQALGYSSLPLDVDVKGKYGNITRFVHALRGLVAKHGDRLQAGGRLFVVDDLNLTTGETDAISATVSVAAFVYTGVIATTTATTSTTTTTAGA